MSGHQQDPALDAVRRVRSARETDSRIGLTAALAASRRCDELARIAMRRLTQAPVFGSDDAAAFGRHVRVGQALARAAGATEQAAASARTVADEATRRWKADRTGLRAVELLLERRAAVRALERGRREGRELDELAAQAWARTREAR